jgi:hypothetical protein
MTLTERWRLWRAERSLARLNRQLRADLANLRRVNAGLRSLLSGHDKEVPDGGNNHP